MKRILSLVLCVTVIFSAINVFAQFDDIDDSTKTWAGEAIESLFEKGIINGYEDGSFRPEGNVTRAEFVKMLSMCFNGGESKKEFTDTKDHWAEKYIDSASGFMYCPGVEFEPDKEASRADIAYAAAKALGLEEAKSEYGEKFSDFNSVKDEMKGEISSAVKNGIIVGYEDLTLRPENPVTRAEAAVIIHRTLGISAPSEDNGEEQKPQEKPPVDEEETKPVKEHIYTLYPGSDYLLIENITKTSLEIDGEEAYRLTYRLANSNKKYSSVIPYDVEVKGLRSSVDAIRPGDVLLMSTAFHGYIGYLHVLASFGQDVPSFDDPYTGLGDYTCAYGKIVSVKSSGKRMIVTLDDGVETKEVIVLTDTDANLYSSWSKGDKWSVGDTGDLDSDYGDVYAFIRFTNGLSTEIMINDVR
jgi:hypothetical protein